MVKWKRFFKLFWANMIILAFISSCQSPEVIRATVDGQFRQHYLASVERKALYDYFYKIAKSDVATQHMQVFDNSMAIIYYQYIQEPNLKALTQTALKAAEREKNIDTALDKGLKAAMDELDPHSHWLNIEELKNLNNSIQGEYVGIGAVVREHSKGVLLQRIYKKGPADLAGLKKGDIITNVNNHRLAGKKLTEIVSLLKGKKGTKANIHILGNQKKYIITRDEVDIDPVYSVLKDKNIIYLRLDVFNEHAAREVKNHLRKEQKQGGRKLILDLRSNPGGLLGEAVRVADIFLPPKKTIISAFGRKKIVNQYWYSKKANAVRNMPIVILTDAHTASAAEIVAAALKDNGRALLLGQRSFGKGSIQEVIPIGNQGALRLTFALYKSPSGKIIQAAGVLPNVQLAYKGDIQRAEDEKNALLPLKRHINEANYVLKREGCKGPEKVDNVLNCALQLLNTNRIDQYIANWQ